MTRYWASWWSDQDADGIPWPVWITGERGIPPRLSQCAVIDAPSEDQLWSEVEVFFPDHERRFISAKPDDWIPPEDRFPE